MIKVYQESQVLPRDEVEAANFSTVSLAHEEIKNNLDNQARLDNCNLPGEFLFKISYRMHNPEWNEDSTEDPIIEVLSDDPWDSLVATGRLMVDSV